LPNGRFICYRFFRLAFEDSPAKSKICWGQANSDSERCDGCNYLKSIPVRLSPQAASCNLRVATFCSRIFEMVVQFSLPVAETKKFLLSMAIKGKHASQ